MGLNKENSNINDNDNLFNSCIILLLLFLPSVSIPEGGLKIDENKLKGYDFQSVQSGTGRLSCGRTALKRCTSTETR